MTLEDKFLISMSREETTADLAFNSTKYIKVIIGLLLLDPNNI